MKKYNILYIVAIMSLLFFGCNASTVNIDGTFEGKIPSYSAGTGANKVTVPEQTIKFSLKRQSFDNVVLLKFEIEEYKYIYYDSINRKYTVGTRNTKDDISISSLYDAKDFIYVRLYIHIGKNSAYQYKVLENGTKLESINHPKGSKPIVFERK